MNKTIIFSLLALAIFSIAVAPTIDNSFAQQVKPDKPGKPDKPDKPVKDKGCQVKVQVKVLNAPFNSTVVANLEDFPVQEKSTENGTDVTFNFNYNKSAAYCPSSGETLFGWVNENEYEVEVTTNNIKKIIVLDNIQIDVVQNPQL